MVYHKYVLIPFTSYLTIAGYVFFFWGAYGSLPTQRCDLVVPADWGWGRSNEMIYRINKFIKSVSTLFYHLRATSLCFGSVTSD